MSEKPSPTWRTVAAVQAGLITTRQLRECRVSARAVTGRIKGERWQPVAHDVVATFTGEPTPEQRLWIGHLHGGPSSLICGVAAAALAGLRGWERDEVQILVPYAAAGPRCRLEHAVLLFASGERNERTAHGARHPRRIGSAAARDSVRSADSPRRAHTRAQGCQLEGGAGRDRRRGTFVAELDVRRLCRDHGIAMPPRQTKRRDASGRVRYTDCEWPLADGRTMVLEVDGSFHMDVEHWEHDLARQRALSRPDLVIVRCTARELKHEPDRVAMDLLRLGVPQAA